MFFVEVIQNMLKQKRTPEQEAKAKAKRAAAARKKRAKKKTSNPEAYQDDNNR